MSIKSNAHKALASAHSYGEAIEALRKDCKGKTREQAKELLLPAVASFPKYDVPLVAGDKAAQGRKVMDKDHPKFETARKALNRLLDAIVEAEGHSKEETPSYTRAQRKAAKEFLALFPNVTTAKACLSAL